MDPVKSLIHSGAFRLETSNEISLLLQHDIFILADGRTRAWQENFRYLDYLDIIILDRIKKKTVNYLIL